MIRSGTGGWEERGQRDWLRDTRAEWAGRSAPLVTSWDGSIEASQTRAEEKPRRSVTDDTDEIVQLFLPDRFVVGTHQPARPNARVDDGRRTLAGIMAGQKERNKFRTRQERWAIHPTRPTKNEPLLRVELYHCSALLVLVLVFHSS